MDVVAVYTQPDRPAGRGRRLVQSPVKQVALKFGIPVEQPVSLRKREPKATLRALIPDLMVVAAYGLILPQSVLDIPTRGCWNVHASLLPRWRGAAPIQHAILAGDDSTGICIMQMEAGLDTGPVLHRAETPIGPEETAGELHDRLAEMGARALIDALRSPGPLTPEEQPDDGVTYAAKIDSSDAVIDWTTPAAAIERRVRAFNPWPVARGDVAGETLRIWRAQVRESLNIEAGGVRVVADGTFVVATGDGALAPLEVQRPGGKRMSARDYLNGRADLRAAQ